MKKNLDRQKSFEKLYQKKRQDGGTYSDTSRITSLVNGRTAEGKNCRGQRLVYTFRNKRNVTIVGLLPKKKQKVQKING